MKISINYLPHRRTQYSFFFVKEILKIKSSLKDKIRINFLLSEDLPILKKCQEILKEGGIENNFFFIPNGDYILKLNTGLKHTDDFFIKMDEDIFMSHKVWEFFLENLDILKDSKNAFLSPLITTGIPTVDCFIQSFCNEEEKKILNDLFLKTPLPSIWGADYSGLEDHTIHAKEWISENFYNSVKKIDHHYKGVHPIRFSAASQNYLLDVILKNFDKLIQENNFSLFIDNKPYFCNSVFAITKDLYSTILNSSDLFRDPFDEVPLNLYIDKNNLNKVFIKNGFAVHPSYNTINVFGIDHTQISDKFFNHEYFK